MRRYKPYGLLAFLFDCIMVLLTGGLWFIWIFVREMRRPRPQSHHYYREWY